MIFNLTDETNNYTIIFLITSYIFSYIKAKIVFKSVFLSNNIEIITLVTFFNIIKTINN